MGRKQDRRSSEARLQAVIAHLEATDEMNDPRHHLAIRDLVLGGPFLVSETYRTALQTPDPEVSLWRAELVAFLRTLVRHEGRMSPTRLTTLGRLSFSSAKIGARVVCTADSESIRDLAILHLQLRLHEVGLHNVRVCDAPDCNHLFVKTYRRTYCSKQCQQRHNKQRLRTKQHEEEERQQKRRRVARARAAGR